MAVHPPEKQRNPTAWSITVLAGALAGAVLFGCRDFSFFTALGDTPRPLIIAPEQVSLAAGVSVTFTADGGTKPYTYSVEPGGGAVDPATGAYTAPGLPGSYSVTVRDARGASSRAAITVVPAAGGLVVFPAALTALLNQSRQLIASGGVGPYIFALAINNSGASIDGATGGYTAGSSIGTDTVRVTDSNVPPNTATVTIDVTDDVTDPASTVDYHVSAVSFPAAGVKGTAVGGGFGFTLQNNGTGGGARPVSWAVFLSADGTLSSGDLILCSGTQAPLASGGTAAVPLAGTWPLEGGSDGYLIVALSAADDLAAGNDVASASPVTLSPADVRYSVSGVNCSRGTTVAGGACAGDFRLANGGAAAGICAVSWTVFASTGAVWDAADPVIDSGSRSGLGAASVAVIPFDGFWPAAAGDYRVFVKIAAADDTTAGDDEAATASPTTVTPPPVNYLPQNVTNTGGAAGGDPLAGTFDLRNTGTESGSRTVYWIAYVSPDAVLHAGDAIVDSGSTAALGPGAATSGIPFTGTWPAEEGDRYLIVKVTAADDVSHADDSAASAVVALSAPNVDYAVTAVTDAGATVAGGPLAGTFDLQNTGSFGGSFTVDWTAYVSSDAALDAGDTIVDSGSLAPLNAGSSHTAVVFDGTWPATVGSRHLLVNAAAADDVNPANDTAATVMPTTVTPRQVDYEVFNVTQPLPPGEAGGAVSGSFQYRNIGSHGGSQTVGWTVYASKDGILDGSDSYVTSGSGESALDFGMTSAVINFSGFWPYRCGDYSLLVRLWASEDVDLSNNLGGAWPTTTRIGYFDEVPSEPNGDWSSFSNDWFTGFTLKPGMQIRINGTLNESDPGPTEDIDDVIGFHTDPATTAVTVTIRWTNCGDAQLFLMSGPNTFLGGVGGADTLQLSHSSPINPGSDIWVDYRNWANPTPGDLGGYTMIITAD